MNILYYFPRDLYERKMSLGRVLYGNAVAEFEPVVDLRVWGPGWDGFDNSLTLGENVRRHFVDSWQPNVLWSYKLAGHHPGLGDLKVDRSVLCFNEAWDSDKTWPDIDAAKATHVVFHHEPDFRLWENLLQSRRIVPVKILHCVDPDYFRSVERTETMGYRNIPAIVTGVLARDIYPLRYAFAEEIRMGHIPGRVRNHPGYRLDSLKSCQHQYLQYTGDLAHARVSLCCTSRHRYPLAKIVESMAAGCLVVTDYPEDTEWLDRLREFVIPVDAWQDRATLSRIVNKTLKDFPAEKAAAGQRYVLDNMTTRHYAKALLNALK